MSYYRKAEAGLARRLGGKTTPASGAIPGAKSDVHAHGFKIEAKATLADRMLICSAWLHKLSTEAREMGMPPALSIQFVTPDGEPRRRGAWVAVPEDLFLEMVERYARDS